MLSFVGLGLYDERSITVRGRERIDAADRAFLELYTSRLAGVSVAELRSVYDTPIELRDREGVERDPEPILSAAAADHVAFLTAGDTMTSTTHADLRLRAADRGIDTEVILGTTAQTAASALTGLQNYRFGKATTLPFPTIVYLDIDASRDRLLAADRAAELLTDQVTGPAVVVARAGGDDPVVRAGSLSELAAASFGPPPHLLVVPGELHQMEREALAELAGLSEA
ncbi:diphthine synthase [Halobacteriales archaeon QH_10_67_13]|nr:MAG: diphthine synthase [Halobacteriales archaeon QH_10_67_13]